MKIISACLMMVMLAAAPVLAAESVVTGEVEAGFRFTTGDRVDESAKFQEYRNMDDGALGSLTLFAARDGFYLDADLYGDQGDSDLQIRGGRFDCAKFSLFYNEFDHNYSWDNLTPFVGVGSNNLTLIAFPITDTTLWHPIDYAIEVKNYGGSVDVTLGSPFFAGVDVITNKKEGTIPFGPSRLSELPLPIDYETTTMTARAGYRSKSLLASLDYTVSNFHNENTLLTWRRPSNNSLNGSSLPPDNDMWQVGGQFVLRELPLKSVLAVRGSYSKLESDGRIGDFADEGILDGEITYTTASVMLRSQPVNRLDTEIAYRYVKKDNDNEATPDDPLEPIILEHFHYTKQNASIEAGYRVTPDNRLTLGYEFLTIDRNEEVRPDATNSKSHMVFGEWKNNSLDLLTARVRYERLWRDMDSDSGLPEPFVHRFDAADKDQDKLILDLELSLMDGLDLGLEYDYRDADYDDTDFGLTDEKAHELILDAAIALPAKARLYAYAAYERVERDSVGHWDDADPPVFPEGIDWEIDQTDKGWSYGAKLEVPLCNEQLKLSAAWDYQKNDGEAEVSSPDTAINPFSGEAFADINDYDDYTLNTVNLKAEYAMNANLSVIVSYLYEKYEFDDRRMQDYVLVSGGNFLSGAYSDPDYEAKVGYVGLKYKF